MAEEKRRKKPARKPYMPMDWPAYLADTSDFDAREHGAYLLLIAHLWMTREPLPADTPRLLRIARLNNRRGHNTLAEVLTKFDRLDDGRYTHKRVAKHLRNVEHVQKQRRAAALVRWAGGANTDNSSRIRPDERKDRAKR